MYSFTFKIDSDHFKHLDEGAEFCNRIEIVVEMWADREEHAVDSFTLYDIDADCERKLEDFPKEEQAKIDREVEDRASDHATDAYESALADEGDRAYDQMRDREMEEER